MKKKQILSLLLAALMLTASCGSTQTGNNTGDDSTSSASSDTSSADETTDQGILAKFTPELQKELGLEGYDFHVFIRPEGEDWSINDLLATEENGDVLNDAVFRRNLWLEQTYGFTLSAGYSADTYGSELTTYILADDGSYDAFFPMGRTAASAATQGLLYDLKELDYIDLKRDCWNQMFQESLEIDGKLFYGMGAISTNSYKAVLMMAFNKDIHQKYKLEDPYQLVADGKWTFDKFNEMAVQVADDLNGDTQMTLEDQFGIAWQTSTAGIPFFYGTGEMITKNNSEGIPELTLETERATDVFNKIRDTIANKNAYYIGADADIYNMFSNGQSLFVVEVLNTLAKFRSSNINFGLLPIPKYDEEQEQYIQSANDWCISPCVVAKNNATPERTGFIIEALAEASKEYLVEPYYKTVLQGKVASDMESAATLDIVINNFVVDNCDMYRWGNIIALVRTGMNDGSELSSIVAANKSAIEAAIDKTIDGIRQ